MSVKKQLITFDILDECRARKRQRLFVDDESTITDKEMEKYMRDITAAEVKSPKPRNKRYLTIREALLEGCTYKVADVDKLAHTYYGQKIVMTLKSPLTGAEHTVYAPKCLARHVLNTAGDLDKKKVGMFKRLNITYHGFTEEAKWINYRFDFHH
jgi:hypothetical protein